MTDKKLWRNRKERKEWARRLQSDDPGLEVVHPHAAGIDVGNGAHYVAVRPDRDPEPVRRFECFTADLHRLADWLQSCQVKTVAMQSTGVYSHGAGANSTSKDEMTWQNAAVLPLRLCKLQRRYRAL
jgi:hypothetical protein